MGEEVIKAGEMLFAILFVISATYLIIFSILFALARYYRKRKKEAIISIGLILLAGSGILYLWIFC